jgi:hypothetical protein
MAGSISRVGANLANGAFIPQIYSLKMQAKFYAASVVPAIANHDWEGEIKGGGTDKVIIRKIPTINIFDHTIGTNPPVQDVTDEYITLLIDKAKGYNFNVSSIDEYQSDIALISKLSEDAAMQMAVQVDKSVLQSVYADVSTANTVGTSIGTTTPTQLTSTEYGIGPLLQGGQVLDANNVPRDGSRWAVVTPLYAQRLKQSDLKSVLITGDNESPLRNGYVGSIDGMKVYVSNNLKNANDATVAAPSECLVGHSSALAFASQFEKPEMLPNPLTFGTLVRGLKVYGFKTVKPEAMALVRVY